MRVAKTVELDVCMLYERNAGKAAQYWQLAPVSKARTSNEPRLPEHFQRRPVQRT
jgi:hypothetical protein